MELFADELFECVQQKSIYEVINIVSCRNIISSSDKYCDCCFNIHETKLGDTRCKTHVAKTSFNKEVICIMVLSQTVAVAGGAVKKIRVAA